MNRNLAVIKLIDDFHLNVDDRAQFVSHPVDLDEAVAGVVHILSEQRCYPSSWSQHEDYDGVLLRMGIGSISAVRKAEIGFARYETVERQQFESTVDAAKYALQAMFSRDIDGVPVGW